MSGPRIPQTGMFGFLPSPPPLQRIVVRGHIACAQLLRAELESHPDAAAAAALLTTLRDWLDAQQFSAELEDSERAALSAGIGTLAIEERERCAWQGHCAIVIAWALHGAQLSVIDPAADATDAAAHLGFFADDAAGRVTRMRLRTRDEIGGLLDVVSAASWRLERAMREPGPVSLERWKPGAYEWPPAVNAFEFAGDELAVGGQAVDRLAQADLWRAWRATHERHRATLWLLGQRPRYTDIRTS